MTIADLEALVDAAYTAYLEARLKPTSTIWLRMARMRPNLAPKLRRCTRSTWPRSTSCASLKSLPTSTPSLTTRTTRSTPFLTSRRLWQGCHPAPQRNGNVGGG
jgi:hypothetical protein